MTPSLKLCAFLLLLCGSSAADLYMIGGDDATENQFPYLTSLRVYEKWYFEHICSASILSDRFLVTAARCCSHHIKPHIYQINVGAHLKTSEGVVYSVEKIYVHPNYTGTPPNKVKNDIAVIQLEKPIILDQNTTTIEINREHSNEKSLCKVAGWGENKEKTPGLKYAKMTTITNDECRKREPPGPVNDKTTVCAQSTAGAEGRVGLCWGDGGDPLVQISNNKLIGVATWVPRSCESGSLEGFTRISEFSQWIDSIINKS